MLHSLNPLHIEELGNLQVQVQAIAASAGADAIYL
jgi:hypothetical protein